PVMCRGDEAAAVSTARVKTLNIGSYALRGLLRYARSPPPKPAPANGIRNAHRDKAAQVEAVPTETTRRPTHPARPAGRRDHRRRTTGTATAVRLSAEMTARSADRHGPLASAMQPIPGGSERLPGGRHSLRGGQPVGDRQSSADPARAPVGVGPGTKRR